MMHVTRLRVKNFFLSSEKLKVLIIQSCQTLCNPMDVAHQASLSIGLSRQEYWSGLPFPPPRGLSDPGIKSISPALAGRFFFFFLPSEPSGKTMKMSLFIKNHWEGFSCVKKRHHLQIPLTKICQKNLQSVNIIRQQDTSSRGVTCALIPSTAYLYSQMDCGGMQRRVQNGRPNFLSSPDGTSTGSAFVPPPPRPQTLNFLFCLGI